jgi:hypothetical protein
VVSAVFAERLSDMIEIRGQDGWYVVTLPKARLLLTRDRTGCYWWLLGAMDA